jgi:hypothetical protein
MPLRLLDILLSLFHFVIIGFNLLGWIWKRTRKLHLVFVLLTAGCWFILGIWFGWGYCPVTDWEWHVKEKLGEYNLPNSFIKYYADKISGRSVDASIIDTVTSVSFFIAALLSVYLNFFNRKRKL